NIAQPEFFHTVTIIIDHKALSELCNQSGCGKWNQPNIWFNKPTSGSYIQAHTIDIATIGVIQGENIIDLKNVIPFSPSLNKMANNNPIKIVGITVKKPNIMVFLSA